MSRIGQLPVEIPQGVTVEVTPTEVQIKGPKGQRVVMLHDGIFVEHKEQILQVNRRRNDKKIRALHGLVRAQIANDIVGVTKGWEKILELHGVGYKASVTGQNLQLIVGFSHPVIIAPPEGVSFQIKEAKVIVSGIDKQLVGQIAADIRAVKKPEPYKGKGIRYVGEYVRKKAGKAAKAVGA
ncbi:50S ribosomal protein L6 [Patescibacteria group bacterium]